MDEAHQAASIEPSLTKIRQKLNELAQSTEQLQLHYKTITMQLQSNYKTSLTNEKGQYHSKYRLSLDQAHQGASIEPSLTKI